ncbi:MAG: response regulator, partial [Bauldia sp.]|nr:response regulator [Bauldia sp.]
MLATTILIVDDDPVQRRLVEATARRFGYEAVSVTGGAAALEALADPDGDRFSLMILDLVMPEIDGMTVLARLRES